MNCRPGDLAVIVPCDDDKPCDLPNIGLIVHVDEAALPLEDGPRWWCHLSGQAKAQCVFDNGGKIFLTKFTFPDRALRPIRGEPHADRSTETTETRRTEEAC